MNDGLQIGEVAKRAGVSIDTLRYYEKVKLLPRASRSTGGFRLFAAEHIERVRFIKQAQELGFSLDEIRDLLANGGAEECQKVHDLLKRKLSEMDERLKSMKEFRQVLARHLLACDVELEKHRDSACCPVLPLNDKKKSFSER
jgi:DNA-binding transcriptional MerR regulator